MQPDQPSRTAEYMALFRAIESVQPPTRRLFTDPFARAFLRPSLRLAVDLARLPLLGKLIPWIIDRRWPGARPSGVARTRLIDDLLLRALHDGIQQVVILGAGFDCRACRLSGMDQVQVIEVDHPTTLHAKRQRLQHLLGSIPAHVYLLAVDLNYQCLEDALSSSPFERCCRSFFLWEGVTNYLSAPAIDATFRGLRQLAEQSLVLFTYVHKAALTNPLSFAGTARLYQTLQRSGEVWTFGFEPNEVPDYLADRGFRLLMDVGSVEYRKQYLNGDGDHLRGYEFYRIALATSSAP